MNISKEQFTKLAKEHLIALESYKMDKNGNKPIEIFGIEKLYEALVVMPIACNYYVSGMDSSMNCINCKEPKYMHLNNK
jgi:hypothetical protein